MRILVTGSAGHLGEAIVRTLRQRGRDAVGMDVKPSPFTDVVGSVADRAAVGRAMADVGGVIHAATLHKPHVATHSRQDFIDVNVSGTLGLLETAAEAGARSFVFTSTTSVFGHAMSPGPGAPAVWIDEDVKPVPKNIYGVTKAAAEDLCQLVQARSAMACLVLRTSRFFPEPDDDPELRAAYPGENSKVNELTYRRLDVADAVEAHLLALERAPAIGFGRYILSATTPFAREDAADLRADAPAVLRRLIPGYEAEYARRGWRMFPSLDRVYDNARARQDLGWAPKYDFADALACLARGEDPNSPLAQAIGSKGYHEQTFKDGPYPVEC